MSARDIREIWEHKTGTRFVSGDHRRKPSAPFFLLDIVLTSILVLGLGWAKSQSLPVSSGSPACSDIDHSAGCARQAIANLGLLKQDIIAYHDGGRWDRDIATVVDEAIQHLSITVSARRNPALVLDIDETSLSNWEELKRSDFGYNKHAFDAWIDKATAPPVAPTLNLFRYAKQHHVAVFFISSRSEAQRTATEKNLRAAGYGAWDGVYLKPNDYHEVSVVPYKSGERKKIAQRGYHIVANVGDQDSDLAGGYAERTFKIPNPAYYVR